MSNPVSLFKTSAFCTRTNSPVLITGKKRELYDGNQQLVASSTIHASCSHQNSCGDSLNSTTCPNHTISKDV